MNDGYIHIYTENRIATLVFFHPASNALPSSLLKEMENKFIELSQDEAINVIVLKSETERVFCAGAFFDELLQIETLQQGVTFFSGFGKVIQAMKNCNKPIIGSIQGKAVGGGVGLIAACDYALATTQASIKLSEISIGIGPFVVEPAISRKIGVAAVGELSFNPKQWQTANWAKEKGLYAHLFEDITQLNQAVANLAQQISTFSPDAVQNVKKILWQGTENWEQLMEERARICGNLVLSKTTKEALYEFKNKQK